MPPNYCNSWSWAKAKLGARNSRPISRMDGRSPNTCTCAIFCGFPRSITRNGIGTARLQKALIRNTGIAIGSGLIHCATMLSTTVLLNIQKGGPQRDSHSPQRTLGVQTVGRDPLGSARCCFLWKNIPPTILGSQVGGETTQLPTQSGSQLSSE